MKSQSFTKAELNTLKAALYDAISDRESFAQCHECSYKPRGVSIGGVLYMKEYEDLVRSTLEQIKKYKELRAKVLGMEAAYRTPKAK